MVVIVLEEAPSIEQGIGLEMNTAVPYNDKMFSANDTVCKGDVLLGWSRYKIKVDCLPFGVVLANFHGTMFFN
jgi:hypothetical protein